VRQWRQRHPGYWRKPKKKSAGTLQDVCRNQATDFQAVVEAYPQDLFRRTLQDVCLAGRQQEIMVLKSKDDIARQVKQLVTQSKAEAHEVFRSGGSLPVGVGKPVAAGCARTSNARQQAGVQVLGARLPGEGRPAALQVPGNTG
jgi:hypothetical protein